MIGIDPARITLTLVLLLLVAVLAWRWMARQRPLPEGARPVSTEAERKTLSQSVIGAFMLVAIGTYGANQLRRLLTLLAACGLEGLVGSILVIENDAQLRLGFHQRIPAVFHDRLVYGYSDALAGGLGGRDIDWALGTIDRWGPPLVRATTEVIDRHLRLNPNRSPSNILFFASLGGHAPLGLPVLQRLHQQFDESMVMAFTSLPRHDELRKRYPELKAEYEKRGVFGWVLSDNLNRDPVTVDYGMVATVVALAEAALHADSPTQPNNAFTLALTREPGAILVYSVVATSVVGFRHPSAPGRPPRYYVFHQPVVEQVLKQLRSLEEGRGIWSVPEAPIGEDGTSTFDIVMVSLYPDDLKNVQDDVTTGRKLRAETLAVTGNGAQQASSMMLGRPNYETLFASIATRIDPLKPTCPVVAVRLAAVRDGARIVPGLVNTHALPVPREVLLTGNGKHAETTTGIVPATDTSAQGEGDRT
jgi:hypothetical protein